MKNIIPIILLFLISLSSFGDIRLQTPYPDNKYNHHKGVHVCISDEFNSQRSKVSITHNETQMVNYSHYPQINTQTYSPYSPFKEKRYTSVGPKSLDFPLPINGRINEILSKRHNLLIGNRHYDFHLHEDGSIDDAIIRTISSDIPSEETESINIASKKNAFAPPTEGYETPINDAVLPLLIFSLIYLVMRLKPVWRKLTSCK